MQQQCAYNSNHPATGVARVRSARGVIVAVALILALFSGQSAEAKDLQDVVVAGYVENVWFKGNKVSLRAKLDTGAKTSSINSPNYELFKRKGKEWVRFRVGNREGGVLAVERKLVRYVRIRRAGSKLSRRPVIKMKICVGGQTGLSEFTLADRSSMNYQVIIGRSFMNEKIIVDPSRAFMVSKRCKRTK